MRGFSIVISPFMKGQHDLDALIEENEGNPSFISHSLHLQTLVEIVIMIR